MGFTCKICSNEVMQPSLPFCLFLLYAFVAYSRDIDLHNIPVQLNLNLYHTHTKKCLEYGRKHCGKMRKLLLPAFSPFPTMFSKGSSILVVKTPDCKVTSGKPATKTKHEQNQ